MKKKIVCDDVEVDFSLEQAASSLTEFGEECRDRLIAANSGMAVVGVAKVAGVEKVVIGHRWAGFEGAVRIDLGVMTADQADELTRRYELVKNQPTFVRLLIALPLVEKLRVAAKKQMSTSKRVAGQKPINVRAELAQTAVCSEGTAGGFVKLGKARKDGLVPDDLWAKLIAGEISISAAIQEIETPQKPAEHVPAPSSAAANIAGESVPLPKR